MFSILPTTPNSLLFNITVESYRKDSLCWNNYSKFPRRVRSFFDTKDTLLIMVDRWNSILFSVELYISLFSVSRLYTLLFLVTRLYILLFSVDHGTGARHSWTMRNIIYARVNSGLRVSFFSFDVLELFSVVLWWTDRWNRRHQLADGYFSINSIVVSRPMFSHR